MIWRQCLPFRRLLRIGRGRPCPRGWATPWPSATCRRQSPPRRGGRRGRSPASYASESRLHARSRTERPPGLGLCRRETVSADPIWVGQTTWCTYTDSLLTTKVTIWLYKLLIKNPTKILKASLQILHVSDRCPTFHTGSRSCDGPCHSWPLARMS